jgi:hypothetical protein
MLLFFKVNTYSKSKLKYLFLKNKTFVKNFLTVVEYFYRRNPYNNRPFAIACLGIAIA